MECNNVAKKCWHVYWKIVKQPSCCTLMVAIDKTFYWLKNRSIYSTCCDKSKGFRGHFQQLLSVLGTRLISQLFTRLPFTSGRFIHLRSIWVSLEMHSCMPKEDFRLKWKRVEKTRCRINCLGRWAVSRFLIYDKTLILLMKVALALAYKR